jgi:tetratricopeptide (TPR) repeat protein
MPIHKNDDDANPQRAASAGYEAALAKYSSAVQALRQGDLAGAKRLFDEAKTMAVQEPELADRASTYSRICERRLLPAGAEPQDTDGQYREAVFLLNSGQIDAALRLLNRAVAANPTAVDVLYVRACAWAKQGAAEKAVGDLRQAIAADPRVRFQAVNDPDFERIREEPAFIDIIEPTPTRV